MTFQLTKLTFFLQSCLRLSLLCLAVSLVAGCMQANELGTGGIQDVGASGLDGEMLFAANCATCHNGRVSKAPPITLLQIMSSASILRSMDEGVMQAQSAHLQPLEKRALVEYLTGSAVAEEFAPPPSCEGESMAFDYAAAPDATNWGVDLGNGRFFDSSVTDITASNVSQLKLKWAFAFPDAIRARSQPTAAGGALFVGSQDGTVYSLDQQSGCVRWTFKTIAEVRTGIAVTPWVSDDGDSARTSLSFFGDLIGNVYAVNTFTGDLIWRDRPSDHPSLTLTATPVLHNNRLIVPLSALEVTEAADPSYACCTFRGGVAVYEAATGKRLWTGYTIDEEPREVSKNAIGTPIIAPSGAPVWGAPTIDAERGLIYVGTGENYSSPAGDTSDAILALSISDGSIVWQQQMTEGDAWNMGCEAEDKSNCPPENGPDYDFGAATILATHSNGKQYLLAGQKSGDVYALNPDEGGKIVWQQKLGRGGIQGGVHFGMAVGGDTLYVPMSDFDGGPRWPGVAKPGMFALNFANGDLHWYTPTEDVCAGKEFCQPGLSAAASAIPGAVVGGAMDGHLRAYDKHSGDVIWDFDAVKRYSSTSGAKAQGGSFGGASGPVFKDRMMFVNSGYGIYFHMPGNVLLAFELAE
ncbi:MAG: PQQ-binding-like beta-propeller repeat protein [Pseudomonadales bacterium]